MFEALPDLLELFFPELFALEALFLLFVLVELFIILTPSFQE